MLAEQAEPQCCAQKVNGGAAYRERNARHRKIVYPQALL